ncbi:hypothetical protein B0T22DRAFT_470210 [Podospora appendiculata]|uniref:Uncharacterized protein n=1 Tax=Podospora appendiculata TaxID=314037 RepID=A0AAE1C7S6_9PEZI|nr:hypothetical protein B0T22DRAFT_470210 [Podospora appendiculata]
MSARYPRQEDPNRRIDKWDDGYEYIAGDQSDEGDSAPHFAPPPKASKPVRRSEYEPDYPEHKRNPYPSPPSASDEHGRPRRHHRDIRPPPMHHPTRSPSPPRRRDRDSRHAAATAPTPRATRGMRNAPAPARTHRSPSPSGHGDRPHGRSDRYRSPTPAPPLERTRYLEREREADREKEREKQRDSDSRQDRSAGKSSAPRRPTISRSKTTSAKDRLAHLSPRWQQAAAAALQAGSMTAYNLRSEPGPWKGEKGARIATAALGAAAIDAFAKGATEKSGGTSKAEQGGGHRSEVETLSSVFGGLIADQIARRGSGRGKGKGKGKKKY